jgi:pyridoxal phosphate enzyme (YggS family)
MISENLRHVREAIEKKCSLVNRNPAEITIIAVSKNFGVNEINSVFNEGIIDFGENRAQELIQKFNSLGNKIRWHFIGNLQRNKVRFAVEASEYIHSVDSLLLAMEINKRAAKLNKIQKILLEIKTSDEETKSGLADESEIFDLSEYCKEYPNIELVGLMTMAPFTNDEKRIRKSFRALRSLRDELNGQGIEIKELSMGMTNDFPIAIEEGATMVRIGTAIFGERNYSAEQDEE